MTANERNAIIANKIKSPSGRMDLAASMKDPLREYRDYTSVGRRMLMVDPLGQGESPIYDKDVNLSAFVVGEEGDDIQQVVKGDSVTVPLFEIATLAQVPLTKVRQRKFDVQNRVKQKSKSEVFRAEDDKIFGAAIKIGTDATVGNPVTPVAAADLSVDTLSEAIGLIERHGDIKCTGIYMNAKNNTLLRKADKDRLINPEMSKELLKFGYFGDLYGATIQNSPSVPEDIIVLTGEPEFVGRLVSAIDLTVMPADNAEKRKVGFSIFEEVGVLFHNPNAIAVIQIS